MTYGASVPQNTPGCNKIACHRASSGITGSLLLRAVEGHVDQAASTALSCPALLGKF